MPERVPGRVKQGKHWEKDRRTLKAKREKKSMTLAKTQLATWR